jgi:L-malate glycosyltransferase
MKSIKLVKVLTAFCAGGTEGQVLKLASSLDKTRFALQFAGLRNSGDLLQEFNALKLPIAEFRISCLYSPRTFLQQLKFVWYLRREGVGIVHSYNFYSNVFAIPAARLAGVPLIVASIRDQGVYLSPMQKLLQKFVCRMADKILVNAASIRSWLVEQGYPADKIVLIRNGIDLSRYARPGMQEAIRAELKIPTTAPLVVMIARLNPQKGVEDFIEAAALVCRSIPDVRFLIVGGKIEYVQGVMSEDMEYLQGLKKLTQALGIEDRVIFTGYRTDTPAILSTAAVSVLPSYSEGLSNTLLESMAAGAPIVATNVGGTPELITHMVNGLLVQPGAPARLAHAIAGILADPALAQKFSLRGKQRAKEDYSIDRMAADTQDFYDRELHNKGMDVALTRGLV